MNLITLFNKIKDISKYETVNFFSFDNIFRNISFFVTPLFYYLRLSPNMISILSLVMGLAGAIVIIIYGESALSIGITLFFISMVIDYCDGNIARLLDKTSFFGRFIDGLFGIIVVGTLQISFLVILVNELASPYSIGNIDIDKIYIITFCVFSIFSYPIQHLIYDRYSSFARWIKQEHNIDVAPTIKNEISFSTIVFLDTLHYISILLGIVNIEFLIVNFIVNLISAILLISYHLYYCKKYMNISAKSHRSTKDNP